MTGLAARPRLGIAGAGGRMGRLLAPAIAESAILAGGLDPSGVPEGVAAYTDIAALAADCDGVIDFSAASTIAHHAKALADAGAFWVLGTTGADEAAEQAVWQAAARIPVLRAANFSAGVTLLLSLARVLGAALPADEYDAEIVEMHHRHKLDAPSGTALALGAAVAGGREADLAALARRGRDGQAGPRLPGEIGFAVLRGGAIVGEHTLSFTAQSEQITLTHRAFDRAVFAQGAVRAALWLQARPAGLYSMEDVLAQPHLATIAER